MDDLKTSNSNCKNCGGLFGRTCSVCHPELYGWRYWGLREDD